MKFVMVKSKGNAETGAALRAPRQVSVMQECYFGQPLQAFWLEALL